MTTSAEREAARNVRIVAQARRIDARATLTILSASAQKFIRYL
jgi:hypothetical protein